MSTSTNEPTTALSSVVLPPSNTVTMDTTIATRQFVPGTKRLSRDDVESILDQFGVAPSSSATSKKRRAEASTTGSTEITFRAPITREILSGLEDNLVFFLETFKERIARYEGYSDACIAHYNKHMTSVQNWQNGASKKPDGTAAASPISVTFSKFSAASLRCRRPRIRLVRDWFLENETHIPRAELPLDQPESEDDADMEGDDDAGAFDSSESSLLDVASDCDFPDTPFGETGLEVDVPEPTSPTMAPLPTFGTGPPLSSLPTSGLSAGTAPLINTPEDAVANRLIRSIKGIPSDFASLMRFVDIVQAEALELHTLLINIRDWIFLSLYAPDDVVFGGSGDGGKNSSPTTKGAPTNFSRTISRLAKSKGNSGSSSVSAGLRTEMQIEIAESITEVLENRADTLETLRQFKTLFLENRRNCLRAYAKFPIIPSYAQAFLANEEDAWRHALDSFKTLRRVCATSFALVGRNLDSLRPCGGTKNKSSRRHALTSIYS